MTRRSDLERSTTETKIRIGLDLDGSGLADVATGIGFLDHLLTSFAHHGLFDLSVAVAGDLDVDDHHTVEDTGLVIGAAFADALGDRTGIHRFGNAVVPMDEALATATVDVGGRPYAVSDLKFGNERVGTLTTQNIPHFLEAFARTSGVTLHMAASGANDHHIAEAAFKALARALRLAVKPDPRRQGLPSTKGAM